MRLRAIGALAAGQRGGQPGSVFEGQLHGILSYSTCRPVPALRQRRLEVSDASAVRAHELLPRKLDPAVVPAALTVTLLGGQLATYRVGGALLVLCGVFLSNRK